MPKLDGSRCAVCLGESRPPAASNILAITGRPDMVGADGGRRRRLAFQAFGFDSVNEELERLGSSERAFSASHQRAALRRSREGPDCG
jgi:hypothetical protein